MHLTLLHQAGAIGLDFRQGRSDRAHLRALRRHALRNRLLELGELPAVLAVAGVDDECQTGIVHL
jgi:hypothetical protein